MKKQHIIWFILGMGLLAALTGCDLRGTNMDPDREPHLVKEYSARYNDYRIITIDSCQYIYMGAYQGQTLTHKGNCNNPIHRR